MREKERVKSNERVLERERIFVLGPLFHRNKREKREENFFHRSPKWETGRGLIFRTVLRVLQQEAE